MILEVVANTDPGPEDTSYVPESPSCMTRGRGPNLPLTSAHHRSEVGTTECCGFVGLHDIVQEVDGRIPSVFVAILSTRMVSGLVDMTLLGLLRYQR